MDDRISILSNYINEIVYELPLILNDRISDKNNRRYNYRVEFQDIIKHIENFINDINDERFIVLPGIRTVGKTTLLFQVYDYLLNERKIPFNQIVYISCDDLNDIIQCSIREFTEIYLKNFHNTTIRLLDKKIFLLIDESQYDNNWALAGKIIFDRTNNIFMIFSGSSALHLEYNADSARRSYNYDIRPVNYSQHLKLKYNINFNIKENLLKNMIFGGKFEECAQKEEEINNILMTNPNISNDEWNNYLFYGGYPIYFNQTNTRKIRDKIVEMTKKVVENDLPKIKNINIENQKNANRILRYLALIESSAVSQNKISIYLDTSRANVENILKLLEQTHLIFHLDAYGSSHNRNKKAWNYYFATSSIKYALASFIGNVSKDKSKYEGILIENLIASKLYEMSDYNYNFSLHYDSGKKANVDFIIQNEFGENIAIKVGIERKDKRQVTKAIEHYDSKYGIIISNYTPKIEKEDNIIYIPPKTFAIL